MSNFRQNARGIAAIMISSFFFIANDALVKLADEELPTGEIIFLRGLASTVLVGAILLATGGLTDWRRVISRIVFWRTAGEIGGTLTYLNALFHLPIANATTIMQAVPLSATVGAALFFGERVGPRRWTAIAVGFVGVLIVMRPGFAGFDAYALWALVAVGFVTLRDLSTRAIDRAIPALLITGFTCLALTIVGAGLGLAETWVWPGTGTWLEVGGAGVALVVGFAAIIVAMRNGDLSVVAPFRYFLVVWATLWGVLVWKQVPDGLTLLGMAVIVAAGVYTFHRERRLQQDLRRAPATGPTAEGNAPRP